MEQRMGGALSKRIKRHVVGRSHLFFVSTSPGLSQLCLKDIESTVTGAVRATIAAGGIEFEGRLVECFAANLNLRTANRILMRITSFKATNFRQLEKSISRLPWELYIHPGSKIRMRVTTRHSRLFHTEAVSQTVRKCIRDRWPAVGIDSGADLCPNPMQTVYIRAVDDRLTVSLDSSGEHLHKRGLKPYPGQAPIRETLAAAVLNWAGYRPGIPLIDPMCGSGTFSLEAAFIAKQIPPGYFRSFAFMGWPAFRPRQWDYLKRVSEKRFQKMVQPLIFASDRAPERARQLEKCVVEYGLTDAVKTACTDFFSLSPGGMAGGTGLVVLNPPYGYRMGNRKESRLMYRAICDKLTHDFSGWRCALILPEQQIIKTKLITMKSHRLYHGGLKLRVLIGSIP